METKHILYIILAFLVVSIALQIYQISSLKERLTGNTITGDAVSSGAVDMSGWTEQEKMMYEHHGTLPARAQSSAGSAQASNSGMVGGC